MGNEADPITLPLCEFMCEWAIVIDNTFFGVFTVTMYNFLSIYININDLKFHNITIATNSRVIKFDSEKIDSKGESATLKNFYSPLIL